MGGQAAAVGAVEEEDGAPQRLALVHRPQRPRRGQVGGARHHLGEARLELVHPALQHDAAAVQDHQVGEDVLHLLHLVRGHHDGPAPVEVVAQQRVVELLPVQDVEPQRGLVQHQEPRVDRHHQRQVELRHHPLRQLAHPAPAPDPRPRQERLRLGAVEARVHPLHVPERLRHPQPAREDGHVGDEADVAHQPVALGPRVAPQDAQLALAAGEPQDGVQRRGLPRPVGAHHAHDAPLVHAQAHPVQRDRPPERLAQLPRFDAGHGVSAPPPARPWTRRVPALESMSMPTAAAPGGRAPAAGWWRGCGATAR